MRRGHGLPCAGHSLFHLAPIIPPHSTAEPLGQDGGNSGKTYLRKGKMLHDNVRGEEKNL